MTLADDGAQGPMDRETVVQVFLDHDSLSLDESTVRRLVSEAIQRHPRSDGVLAEVGIILSRRETVHRLNREFLGHDYPTDVLSFLVTDVPPHEGEVYVDLDMAAERCLEFDTAFELEALRYVVHGVLHLLEMDDATADAKERMHQAEDDILSFL